MLVKVQLVKFDGNTDEIIKGREIYINTSYIIRMDENIDYTSVFLTDGNCYAVDSESVNEILIGQFPS